MESDDNAVINGIRQNTKTGRPCGGKSFIKKEINGIIKGKTAKEKNKWLPSLLFPHIDRCIEMVGFPRYSAVY
ncbi:MAG: hypothetical protein M5U17_17305 [Ignavibacterium sp.]|nr:hypothetical protein [Ignavibacterium sp.]